MSTQVAQPLLGQFTFPSKNALGVDAFGALAYGYPSPPASNGGSDVDLTSLALPADFDFDAFTHCATAHNGLEDPFSLDVDFSQAALCPSVFGHSPASEGSVATPSSTTLVSPKASFSLSTLDILPTPASFDNKSAASFSTLTAPLPSVPVPNAAAAALELSPNEAEALSNHHLQRYLHYKALAAQAEAEARALALQQSEQQFDALFASFTMPSSDTAQKVEEQVPAYQPVQEVASIHHAQAQAHFQAHDAAARLVAQAKTAQPQFVVPAVAAPSVAVPAFAPVAPVAAVERVTAMSTASSVAPSIATSEHSPRSEGESETDDASTDSIDTRLVSVNGLALTNLHGGGRGYVPGKTPDDPEKRHKCQVCGRGFARAFNLKSHIQTHNPLRSKPHQCPHASCRRGFSRLHDLERHRQGIHSDGPLVDAKRKVVSPSSAASRAQDKVQNRAEHGSLN